MLKSSIVFFISTAIFLKLLVIILFWPYISELIGQIKYDLRLNDFSPKWHKNIHPGKPTPTKRAHGSKW